MFFYVATHEATEGLLTVVALTSHTRRGKPRSSDTGLVASWVSYTYSKITDKKRRRGQNQARVRKGEGKKKEKEERMVI